ncbi:transposase [Paracoccus sp. MC1854]|nr:transposase [Paracoccus sp. MC1854]
MSSLDPPGREEDQETVRGTVCPTTGRCESFTAKLRDERLTGDILCSLAEAKIVLAAGRRPCTTKRPHSSPGERPPAPEVPQGPPSPPGAWRQHPSCTKIGKGPPQQGRPIPLELLAAYHCHIQSPSW